ncbi:GtrA family protein [Kitasatospora sp. NPDC056651]|uniref:GtrA family protein n=1 Tax=Kitasatospora sp. NPDC056651 TaxID=3345892 RepID=UPI0036D0B7C1
MTALDSTHAGSEPSAKGGLTRLLGNRVVRFLFAGGVSTTVDMGTLYVLHGVSHVQLALATFGAVLAGFVTNFLLNRLWAFESTSPIGGQTVRYLVMAGGNWIGTVLLVGGLVKMGVYYLIARALVLGVLSVANFLGYKHWVFKTS